MTEKKKWCTSSGHFNSPPYFFLFPYEEFWFLFPFIYIFIFRLCSSFEQKKTENFAILSLVVCYFLLEVILLLVQVPAAVGVCFSYH